MGDCTIRKEAGDGAKLLRRKQWQGLAAGEEAMRKLVWDGKRERREKINKETIKK